MPLIVPRAARQITSVLDDLTTSGTVPLGRSVAADWAGLHAAATPKSPPVPGVQIDGHFLSRTRLNSHHGWDADAQFVLRLPHDWNGKLVVTAAPGVRRQYAIDRTIGDWMLERGYAYAATDKGNSGPDFFTAGNKPGDTLVEWDRRTAQLTEAARETVCAHYGRAAERVYVTGMSNGGYVTRRQLEAHPELYDAGVDWEGPLWRANGPNLFTHLPLWLTHYPSYRRDASAQGYQALIAAGLPEGSDFLWELHYQHYWDFTQRTYRAVFDPGYGIGGSRAGTAFAARGVPGSDADYRYLERPRHVREAVGRVSLNGRIGKPLLSLHGTLDCLLPIAWHSDFYAELVAHAGRGHLHRQYRIEGGNHVDGFCDLFPDRVRPLLPAYRAAWLAMEAWVERGIAPPSSRTIAWDRDRDELADFAW